MNFSFLKAMCDLDLRLKVTDDQIILETWRGDDHFFAGCKLDKHFILADDQAKWENYFLPMITSIERGITKASIRNGQFFKHH